MLSRQWETSRIDETLGQKIPPGFSLSLVRISQVTSSLRGMGRIFTTAFSCPWDRCRPYHLRWPYCSLSLEKIKFESELESIPTKINVAWLHWSYECYQLNYNLSRVKIRYTMVDIWAIQIYDYCKDDDGYSHNSPGIDFFRPIGPST